MYYCFRHCKEYNVLGIGCELVKHMSDKITLLLLASHRGLCALVRLYNLTYIPTELRVCDIKIRLKKSGGGHKVSDGRTAIQIYSFSILTVRPSGALYPSPKKRNK